MSRGTPAMGPSIHRLAHALSDPVRVALLTRVGAKEMSATEAAKEVQLPLGNVAYHMRILRDLGLIVAVEEIKVRGATMTIFRARSADELRSMSVPFPRTRVGEAEARMYELLLRAVEEATRATVVSRRRVVRPGPFLVDEEAWSAMASVLDEASTKIGEIARACQRRLDGGEELATACAELVLGESMR